MDLYDELLNLVILFEQNGIEYALCGGVAVAFHGYPRFTKDIDILVQEDAIPEIERLVATQGYTLTSGKIPFAVGTPEFREIYRISKVVGQDIFTLDFIIVTPIFTDVWEDRELFEWQSKNVQVVSVNGLAKMKQLAGRDQDILDLKKLGVIEDDSEEDS